ncbi:MAG: sigma 54-interacting transcriptional regulator, partial [Nitrospira sp.]|nr:sigma 54-interacting transcriptional regulator [Nitrospira sp.]
MQPKQRENKAGKEASTPQEGETIAMAVLDALVDAVVMVGPDAHIQYLNKVAEQLLGYFLDEAKGQHCAQIMRCDVCYDGCLMEQMVQTGEGRSDFETVLRSRDGRLVRIGGYATLIRDKAGKSIGGVQVFRDVSQMRTFSEPRKGSYKVGHVIGKNHKIREIYELLPEISKTKSTVLIEGESGTGKELLAHAVHQLSPRRDKPFIRVNCGALAEGILESELFGHIKGAFTGAIATKIGRFELADTGTIFLDEIGDISLSTQVKLLRVLQEEEFERVGDTKRIKVDVRVIAATHKDLIKAIQQGEFRADLYYRLRVMPIHLPPLKERKEDIPLLINHFLAKFNREFSRKVEGLSGEAMGVLLNYHYPGNIRELENIIEHAMVLCTVPTIQIEHLPMDIRTFEGSFNLESQEVMGLQNKDGSKGVVKRVIPMDDPLKVSEREAILRILEQTKWNYGETARRLKKSRVTLWRKMKELGITASKQYREGL